MLSSVFPIYLLAKEVLENKFKAVLVALVSLLIPEFTAVYFIVQEVLFYPVFLWCAYLVYLKFAREKSKMRDIIAIFLFAILFFIKSYAIVFAVAYFGALVLIEFKNKNYKKCGYAILQGISCLVLVIIGMFIIKLYNGEGVNHYDGQIASIFPITIVEIKAFFYGICYYSVFFLLCTGFLPLLVPILKIKSYNEKDRKFIFFLILSTIFTLIEVAFIVFVPEERARKLPGKFCYRYLAVLTVPYVIMFLKCKKEDAKMTKTMIAIYIASFAYLLPYFIIRGAGTTAIDAGMLYAIQLTCDIKFGLKFGVRINCSCNCCVSRNYNFR